MQLLVQLIANAIQFTCTTSCVLCLTSYSERMAAVLEICN